MIQGQQSFAQQQEKAAVCEWKYKHSLTSLDCYEYASKTKQFQFKTLLISGSRCCKCNLYRPWMDVITNRRVFADVIVYIFAQ